VMVRLTQIDGKLPNLALMKLAHHHRAQGDGITFSKHVERDMLEPAYGRVPTIRSIRTSTALLALRSAAVGSSAGFVSSRRRKGRRAQSTPSPQSGAENPTRGTSTSSTTTSSVSPANSGRLGLMRYGQAASRSASTRA
jgi:hypothetical protein